MLDKTMQVLQAKQTWNLDEMNKVTCMLKNLSEVEKNCAKSLALSQETSEEVF